MPLRVRASPKPKAPLRILSCLGVLETLLHQQLVLSAIFLTLLTTVRDGGCEKNGISVLSVVSYSDFPIYVAVRYNFTAMALSEAPSKRTARSMALACRENVAGTCCTALLLAMAMAPAAATCLSQTKLFALEDEGDSMSSIDANSLPSMDFAISNALIFAHFGKAARNACNVIAAICGLMLVTTLTKKNSMIVDATSFNYVSIAAVGTVIGYIGYMTNVLGLCSASKRISSLTKISMIIFYEKDLGTEWRMKGD